MYIAALLRVLAWLKIGGFYHHVSHTINGRVQLFVRGPFKTCDNPYASNKFVSASVEYHLICPHNVERPSSNVR